MRRSLRTPRAAARSLAPALLALAVATAAPAGAADAPPTRLFLHSATGAYLTDALGTPPYAAPPGATMTTAPPARTASATARSVYPVPGGPLSPTWSNPLKGTVRNVCVDLFISSTAIGPTSVPPVNRALYVTARSHVGGASGTSYTHGFSVNDFPNGIVRVTGFAAPAGPYDVDGTSLFLLHGLTANNPDWTLHYDSAAHFSSVTFNTTKERCAPDRLRPPKLR